MALVDELYCPEKLDVTRIVREAKTNLEHDKKSEASLIANDKKFLGKNILPRTR